VLKTRLNIQLFSLLFSFWLNGFGGLGENWSDANEDCGLSATVTLFDDGRMVFFHRLIEIVWLKREEWGRQEEGRLCRLGWYVKLLVRGIEGYFEGSWGFSKGGARWYVFASVQFFRSV